MSNVKSDILVIIIAGEFFRETQIFKYFIL